MNRDLSLDTLKGFLIVLVILGHLIGSLNTSGGVWNLIYTVHMPLFVLISGYFSKHDKLKISNIVKPLLVFQLVNVVLLLLLGNGFSVSYFYVPYWTLWYLLSLIFWRIILRYTPQCILDNPYLLLALTIIGAMLIGTFLPHGRILSIQRTISFFPFFLMGYYFKTNLIKQTLWSKKVSWVLLIAVSIVILFIWFPSNASILLRGADPYSISDVPAKLFISCCTIVLIYSLWNLKYENDCFAKIGKDSLFYYLYHGLFIKFLIVPLVVKVGLPTNLWCCMVYLFFILIALHVMSKINIFRWLVNPTIKQQ